MSKPFYKIVRYLSKENLISKTYGQYHKGKYYNVFDLEKALKKYKKKYPHLFFSKEYFPFGK